MYDKARDGRQRSEQKEKRRKKKLTTRRARARESLKSTQKTIRDADSLANEVTRRALRAHHCSPPPPLLPPPSPPPSVCRLLTYKEREANVRELDRFARANTKAFVPRRGACCVLRVQARDVFISGGDDDGGDANGAAAATQTGRRRRRATLCAQPRATANLEIAAAQGTRPYQRLPTLALAMHTNNKKSLNFYRAKIARILTEATRLHAREWRSQSLLSKITHFVARKSRPPTRPRGERASRHAPKDEELEFAIGASTSALERERKSERNTRAERGGGCAAAAAAA